MAIIDPNGYGKSTLIQLMKGLLVPDTGKILIGVDNISYLNQSVSFLVDELSIIDNFLKFNPQAKTTEAYSALASFMF